MTAESSSIDVAPHWLMRLFGAQAATFSLGDKGLEVTTKNGENYLIEATSLANEATFQEGIVFPAGAANGLRRKGVPWPAQG